MAPLHLSHLIRMTAIRHISIQLLGAQFVLLAVLGGCNGPGGALKGFSPGKIVDGSKDAEIRQAAIEDNSFPSATEPAATK